jgi:hypothetical protein
MQMVQVYQISLLLSPEIHYSGIHYNASSMKRNAVYVKPFNEKWSCGSFQRCWLTMVTSNQLYWRSVVSHTDPPYRFPYFNLTAGRVDSAWWAIMTHPLISEQLIDELYGFLHMLGHEYTNGYHKEQTRRTTLEKKVTMLEEVLGSERQHYRRELRQLRGEITALQREAAKYQSLIAENSLLRAEKAVLGERVQQLTTNPEEAGAQQRLAAGQEGFARLQEEFAKQGQELALVRQQMAAMEEEQARMVRQRTDQAREISSLESMLLQRMSGPDPCTVCADHNTAQCPGLSLCGKTVLYVGGLHKMVPHYRQMVEHLGGRFMHHDGGKEASRNLLPKMLVTADAVFCPIDCVSHDACKQVKKMCKRYRKPFVLMRSSGLSSLAKGLNEIVQ